MSHFGKKHLRFVGSIDIKIMKKIALLASAITTLISSTFAQSDFQLGLKLSPNFSWFNAQSENLQSDGANFGFNYGLVGDFNISENYSFSTGIMLVNTGGELDYPSVVAVDANGTSTEFGGRKTADVTLKYIEIPLTLKLKTNEIGYLTYFCQFGLGLGVNYDATADVDFNYSGASGAISNEEVDFSDETNLFRASLIVGLGAEYNLTGNTSLVFGFTFNDGFTNVLKEDGYDADANGNGVAPRNKDFKAINNYLVLNVGVLF